jgi:hypothetical protein
MPNATLTTIRAALLARLQTLLTTADPAGAFRHVANWTGDTSRERLVSHDALGDGPALLLALAGETYEGAPVSVALGPVEFAARPTWRVYVVFYDVREPDAVAGSTDDDGLTPLLDAVIACLAGFEIAGLDQVETVRLVALRPIRAGNGEFVYGLDVVTERVVDAAVRPDAASPDFDRVTANENLVHPDGITVPASLTPFNVVIDED